MKKVSDSSTFYKYKLVPHLLNLFVSNVLKIYITVNIWYLIFNRYISNDKLHGSFNCFKNKNLTLF